MVQKSDVRIREQRAIYIDSDGRLHSKVFRVATYQVARDVAEAYAIANNWSLITLFTAVL